MSFCAGVFFMRYATNNQVYSAQSIIKYTYAKAEEGKTPNGADLDVSEIFSSTVVKEAIENLGLSTNVDRIRSGGVKKGDVLMILEAMKMENEIMAPCDGAVTSVAVTKGASVESGTLLCTIG